jgi:predicted Holliday junction resolvase-like endonuclease
MKCMDSRSIIVWVALWLLWAYFLAKVFNWVDILGHRKDAVKKAKSVVLGQASENVAPLMVDFPFHYKDCVFLWKGVDYIVFDGLYEWNLREIIFVEIKTWSSRLNKNEKMIRDIVKNGVISYELIRVKT